MKFDPNSFFSDIAEDAFTQNDDQDDCFFSETLACPPLDDHYLFAVGTDHTSSSIATFLDKDYDLELPKAKIIHGQGKPMKLLEELLRPKKNEVPCDHVKNIHHGKEETTRISEVVVRAKSDKVSCDNVKSIHHGKSKSMRKLEEVLRPKKKEMKNHQPSYRVIKSNVDETLISDCKADETLWLQKLELTSKHLHQMYEQEHKKKKNIKLIDIKDCPKQSICHRRLPQRKLVFYSRHR